MKQKINWIVVMDSKIAHILENIKIKGEKSNLTLIKELVHEPVEPIKPGRVFDRMGMGRHSIEAHTDPYDVDREHFAAEISHFLEGAAKNNRFEELILVAPHRMMDFLYKALGNNTIQKIAHKIYKNIANVKDREIEEYLSKLIKL